MEYKCVHILCEVGSRPVLECLWYVTNGAKDENDVCPSPVYHFSEIRPEIVRQSSKCDFIRQRITARG
jgi:hypothetical protein